MVADRDDPDRQFDSTATDGAWSWDKRYQGSLAFREKGGVTRMQLDLDDLAFFDHGTRRMGLDLNSLE